jgi:hypothetical protein
MTHLVKEKCELCNVHYLAKNRSAHERSVTHRANAETEAQKDPLGDVLKLIQKIKNFKTSK